MACGSTASSRHRSDLAASSVAVPQPRTVIEYRKDGAPSKMRSHKGNIPILPQTKLCPHCPAKFTRTTHLNRHLRTREYSHLSLFGHKHRTSLGRTPTDTGDRSHRCDVRDFLSKNVFLSSIPHAKDRTLNPDRHVMRSLPAVIC